MVAGGQYIRNLPTSSKSLRGPMEIDLRLPCTYFWQVLFVLNILEVIPCFSGVVNRRQVLHAKNASSVVQAPREIEFLEKYGRPAKHMIHQRAARSFRGPPGSSV